METSNLERYERQCMLPEIGPEGQAKLKQAKVLLVGVGGLGSPISLYLTGAGIGTLGLVDDDVVGISNLQRQILYTEGEVGLSKAVQAQKRLQSLNPEVRINAYTLRLGPDNAEKLVDSYDIIVDGCDNFVTRYLINDICLKKNKIYVYGAIRAFDGQVSVFNYPGSHSNYRSIFPNEEEILSMPHPPKGVMGITPGIVGCIEASEVIKIICGFGEILSDKLWTIDLKSMQTEIISL